MQYLSEFLTIIKFPESKIGLCEFGFVIIYHIKGLLDAERWVFKYENN